VPATGQALPVSFSSAGGQRSLAFTVAFDPALLNITAARAGAGLPAGSVVTFVREAAPGGGQQARISITLPGNATLAAGTLRLIDLVASVPASAVYGRSQLLDLTLTAVNGAAPVGGSADDDGLHVVGYVGDTNGNASYAAADATLIQRVVTKLDPGFAFWRNIDPLLVADVDGNSVLNVLDATKLTREINFIAGVAGSADQPEIPPIPRGLVVNFASPASASPAAATTQAVADAAPAMRFDLTPPSAKAAAAPAPMDSGADKPWLRSYLTQAGQVPLTPNATLKVVLPTASKEAA
jgi:hypothetical protein